VASIGTTLKQAETELEQLQADLNAITLGVPNVPHASVPDGKDERDNQEVRRWANRETRFTPKITSISAKASVLWISKCSQDFRCALCSVAGALAQLHRALIQFMLDLHTREHGYTKPMFRTW